MFINLKISKFTWKITKQTSASHNSGGYKTENSNSSNGQLLKRNQAQEHDHIKSKDDDWCPRQPDESPMFLMKPAG